ncbi:MAG TPA: PadR family transcriptional regulator [Vicinamibacterales bacterium]|nr:PadR family transcriptional regulator [Vicinamibacterales bacterium]
MPAPDSALIPGTFEMLILKALSLGPIHGWGVAERIERLSNGVCDIQQGAVYPALQRLLLKGWVTASWRESDNGRRARYYRLTASGRGRLQQELTWWRRAIGGVDRVLRATGEES